MSWAAASHGNRRRPERGRRSRGSRSLGALALAVIAPKSGGGICAARERFGRRRRGGAGSQKCRSERLIGRCGCGDFILNSGASRWRNGNLDRRGFLPRPVQEDGASGEACSQTVAFLMGEGARFRLRRGEATMPVVGLTRAMVPVVLEGYERARARATV